MAHRREAARQWIRSLVSPGGYRALFHPKTHFEDDQPLKAVGPGTEYYATTAIADHGIKYLSEHAVEHGGHPFILYLAFTAPHFPLHARPEDITGYRGRYRAGWEAVRLERWNKIQNLGLVRGKLSEVEREIGPPYDFPNALALLGPREVNRPLPRDQLSVEREFQSVKMTLHAAMVDRMDREIGRVLGQLRRMGAFEDTLIFFLSDNGAGAEIMVRDDGHDPMAAPGSAASHLCLGPGWSSVANTPFRRHKTWVHEGGIATPFIVHCGMAGRRKGDAARTLAISSIWCLQFWKSLVQRHERTRLLSPRRNYREKAWYRPS